MNRGIVLLFVVLGLGLGLSGTAADFSGDGTGDVAIFRESSGLWAVRGVTRAYFGGMGDIPVPGDYSGDRADREAIFRPASGLWVVRGLTRVYFGGSGDEPMPGDYSGDGTSSPAIFRPSTGLWAVKGVTRIYFGSATDEALEAGPVKDPLKVINDSTTAQAAGFYAAFDLATVQPDLDSANIRGGATIFGVAGDPNVADTSSGNSQGNDIRQDKKAWVDGTEVTGTLNERSVNPNNLIQLGGIYTLFNLQNVDPDLAAGNIKKDEVVYGIIGTYNGPGLLWTGQTEIYRTGDDGYYGDGAAFSYQTLDPAGNGEVVTVDNVTGLMWASDGSGAGCNFGNQTIWDAALDWAEGLTFAGYSDWKLPNRRQLESLIDSGIYDPTINTAYFPNTVSSEYWSGSTYAKGTTRAWTVSFSEGYLNNPSKVATPYYVRAVRISE